MTANKATAPITEKTGRRVADALERIANAQETLAMMLHAFASEEEPGFPQTILTQHGPIEIR